MQAANPCDQYHRRDEGPCSAITARTAKNRLALISMTMEINDVKHMNSVIERLKRISGVQSVRRAVVN